MQWEKFNRAMTDFGNRTRRVTDVMMKVLAGLFLLLLLLYALDPYLRHRHVPLHDWAVSILMLCLVCLMWATRLPAPVPFMPFQEWRRRCWQSTAYWWNVLVCAPPAFSAAWVILSHRHELPATLYLAGCTILTVIVRPYHRWPLY